MLPSVLNQLIIITRVNGRSILRCVVCSAVMMRKILVVEKDTHRPGGGGGVNGVKMYVTVIFCTVRVVVKNFVRVLINYCNRADMSR